MTTETQILQLVREQKIEDLAQIKHDLTIKRMKMDKFFTLFLDKFERKMSPETLDTPIWKLYRSKLKEYEGIQRALTMADYYLRKN